MLNGAACHRTFRLVVIPVVYDSIVYDSIVYDSIVYDSRMAEFADQLVVAECLQPGVVAERLLLDVGDHRLFPDEADPGCVQRRILLHEVAAADTQMPVVQLAVRRVHQVGHPLRFGIIRFQPTT